MDSSSMVTDFEQFALEGKPHSKYKYCVDTCKYKGKECDDAGGMVHCYMCSRWYHERCVNYDSLLMKASLFSCQSCSRMPAMTFAILSSLIPLSKDNRSMKSDMKSMSKDLKNISKQLAEANKEISNLKKENMDLREKISKQQTLSQAQTWSKFREQGSKNLLIGDDTIQKVVPKNLVRTDVKLFKNGSFKDVRNELSSRLEANQVTTYDEIFISVGSQDCKMSTSLEDCLQEARSIAECSKSLAEKVTVWSGLLSICSEINVLFLNNDNTFYLSNGNVNEGYMSNDGKTLNVYGTNRLCKNHKLPLKHNLSDVIQRPLKPQSNRAHQEACLPSYLSQAHVPSYMYQRPLQRPVPLISLKWNGSPNKNPYPVPQGDTRGHNHRCHFCSEPGHTKEVCRHGKPLQCQRCLRYGHKSKFCMA